MDKKRFKRTPWWYHGLLLCFVAFGTSQNLRSESLNASSFLLMAVLVLIVLAKFITSTIEQRAQFTLKGMLWFTVCFALGCSAYVTLGFEAVIALFLLVLFVSTVYIDDHNKED